MTMTNDHAAEILKAYKQRLESSASNQLDSDIEAFDCALKSLATPKVAIFSEGGDKEALKEELLRILDSQDWGAASSISSSALIAHCKQGIKECDALKDKYRDTNEYISHIFEGMSEAYCDILNLLWGRPCTTPITPQELE